MSEMHYVSTAQVSQALGISVSTIKRWVDEGILPAHKTLGGHRKLLLADVLRLVQERHFPQLNLAKLNQASSTTDTDFLRKELLSNLRSGKADGVRGVIQGAYQSGLGMVALADEVIGPAMNAMGHEWELGRIDVLHEHRGTQLCKAALFELKALLEANAEKERPVAVGGGPENDYYILPNLLAQMVLLESGWDAVNLGPHTPMSSFAKSLVEIRPQLIWISASHLTNPVQFLKDYRDFYKKAQRAGVPVAIGGQALTEDIRKEMSYTSFGGHLQCLAAFARTLHPRPALPRRGRPPLIS
jgi:excisionase family DNA binding protein